MLEMMVSRPTTSDVLKRRLQNYYN